MIVVYIGIAIMAIGVTMFLIPMALDKWEALAKAGFIVFCVGIFITLIALLVSQGGVYFGMGD